MLHRTRLGRACTVCCAPAGHPLARLPTASLCNYWQPTRPAAVPPARLPNGCAVQRLQRLVALVLVRQRAAAGAARSVHAELGAAVLSLPSALLAMVGEALTRQWPADARRAELHALTVAQPLGFGAANLLPPPSPCDQVCICLAAFEASTN